MNTQKLNKIKKLSFENLETLEKMEILLDLMHLDADGKKPYAVWINILKEQVHSLDNNSIELNNELDFE